MIWNHWKVLLQVVHQLVRPPCNYAKNGWNCRISDKVNCQHSFQNEGVLLYLPWFTNELATTASALIQLLDISSQKIQQLNSWAIEILVIILSTIKVNVIKRMFEEDVLKSSQFKSQTITQEIAKHFIICNKFWSCYLFLSHSLNLFRI